MEIIGNADLWAGIGVGFIIGAVSVIYSLPPEVRDQIKRKDKS